MLQTIELKPKAARQLVLDSQGLAREASFGRGKKAVAEAIHQLNYVQIDTISVIQRAHHHVMNTRIPGYQESMLHTLQAVDNSVFEYCLTLQPIYPCGILDTTSRSCRDSLRTAPAIKS